MQPTFLPWLGWFDIVDQSDVVVLLDDVSFSKQSWQQRNRIRTAQGLDIVSVPVKTAGRLGQPICEVEVANPDFHVRVLGKISMAYRRAPYFETYFHSFSEHLNLARRSGLLVDVNIELISFLCESLGVATPMVRSSGLGVQGRRGGKVAALCEAVQATQYLSPAASQAYLLEDRSAFDVRGVSVELQVYEHPEYSQVFQPFEPYACALDLLFNEGPSSLRIIRQGRRTPRTLTNEER
ncbi:MAG: hypothetical protein JW395_0493 [Nitrospira sp.]|nr:hypothetical protein [Nitrospira sp.]